jgi:membrane associated rhomboid family serine protease
LQTCSTLTQAAHETPTEPSPSGVGHSAWMRANAFPLAPSFAAYGIWHRERPRGYPDLQTLARALNSASDLVWTPASEHCVVPAEVPELRSKLFELEVATTKSIRGQVWPLSIVLGLSVLMHANDLREVASSAVGWLFFGLLPLIWSPWRVRQLQRRGPALAARAIPARRFDRWRASKIGLVDAAPALVILVLFVFELSAGLKFATERLGVQRDFVQSGEWWRLLTCALLHGGVLHVALNAFAISGLSALLRPLIGNARLLSCLFVSILGGSLASIAWHPHTLSVGISGGIAGLVGCELWLWFEHRDTVPASEMGTLLCLIAAIALIGAGSDFIDNAAHAGGLIAGILCGICYRGASALPLPSTRASIVSGAFSALVLSCAVIYSIGFI